jgi:hypothetical protein
MNSKHAKAIRRLAWKMRAPVYYDCNEWAIIGKYGCVEVRGGGFCVYADWKCPKIRRWYLSLLRKFCRVVEAAEGSATLEIDRMPRQMEANMLQGALQIRRCKRISRPREVFNSYRPKRRKVRER